MARHVKRRSVLKGAGAAGMISVAGCLGGGDDGNETGDGGGGSEIGLQIETKVEDTETNSQSGVSAANSLVNAGFPSICGSASSGVNVPVCQEVLIDGKVVGCSPSSTALSVTNLEDDDYIFRTAPSDFLQGQVMAQVAADEQSASTAASLYVNNDYGQQLSERFTEIFEGDVGGEMQTQVAFNQGESSYSSVVNEALSGDPDTLVVIGYPEDGIQLFRDFYGVADQNQSVLVPDGLRDPDIPGQVGADMSNVLGTAPAAGGPNQDAFESLFEDAYDKTPGVFTSQSYDSVAVQILANAAAGENDGTAIRDQMRRVANPEGMEVGPGNFVEGVEAAADGKDVFYNGASSAVNFDENGDPASATYALWEFADGSTSEVTTQTFESDNPDGAGEMADEGPGGFDRTIKVGILLPETGALASTGGPMIQAAELPAMQVNGEI
nr:ABC transporter substrate-binding protein [Halosolutus gelatinilyticus]